jgi:hypothetical protein
VNLHLATVAGLAGLLLSHAAFAQTPMGGVVPQPRPQELKVLEEFPQEIEYEGNRLYDFELDPPPGSVLPAGSRVVLKFKYETDKPGKVFIGSEPLLDERPVGGYQPATLLEKEGTAEVGIFFGLHGFGAGPTKTPTTLEELRASYQPVNRLAVTVYGMVEKEGKFRMPIKYEVIPAATFTVQEKFYLDRLLKEVVALRKRVQELEAQELETKVK